MAINEKHSFKDYTGVDLLSLSADEFSNSVINNTNFYQENSTGLSQWFNRFPEGTQNVAFLACNLDNVLLPESSQMDDWCSHRQFIMTEIGNVEV